MDPHRLAASGAWGTVEWAINAAGRLPAREFYESQLNDEQKAKTLTLFSRMAEHGTLGNREKFRNLGDKAGKQGKVLWEFKSHQVRFVGDFRPGHRFMLAHGLIKKQDLLPPQDVAKAIRILGECDDYELKHEAHR